MFSLITGWLLSADIMIVTEKVVHQMEERMGLIKSVELTAGERLLVYEKAFDWTSDERVQVVLLKQLAKDDSLIEGDIRIGDTVWRVVKELMPVNRRVLRLKD